MSTTEQRESLRRSGNLIIIRGIPGSGKSYFADQLIENLGSDVLRIDPDSYRFKPGTASNLHNLSHDEFYDALNNLALGTLRKGGLVVWEQVWSNLITRADIDIDVLNVLCPSRFLFIEIDISGDAAWDRVRRRIESGRQAGPDFEDFNRYLSRYSSVKSLLSTEEHISLDGQAEVNKNVVKVLNRLKERMMI